MSRVLPNPLTVGYPVKFESGGDRTNDAFHKHIQEIERIYGYLQSLDEGKVSADEVSGSLSGINSSLTSHINSTNPHPNWKPSVSWSDLTNKPKLADLSGNLPASRVDGLASAITALIPASSGDGITNSNIDNSGYVKFKNGLIIQWGREKITKAEFDTAGEASRSVSFPIEFSEKCYTVTAGTEIDAANNAYAEVVMQARDITTAGFKYVPQVFYGSSSNAWNTIYCNYIAIGK